MIRGFADKDTEKLFQQDRVQRFQAFERVALRKLLILNQSRTLADMKGPGFALEALKGARKGQHSIRINDQWRVIFTWKNGDAYDVEIIDYH